MKHLALDSLSRRGSREHIHLGSLVFFVVVVLVFFGFLLQQLYVLQIDRNEEFRDLAEKNYLRTQPIQAYRGMLKDRRGSILAENRPSLNAYLYPHRMIDVKTEVMIIAKILGLSFDEQDELEATIAKAVSVGARGRLLLRQDLPHEKIALLEAKHIDLPGLRIEPSTRRYYPLGSLGAHIVGYMKEVSQDDINNSDNYESGDLIGKSGVERAFEALLRGKKGWLKQVRDSRETIQKDEAAARYYQGETEQQPEAGNDVTLTIDAELQRAVDLAFRNVRSGAAVVLEVNSGRLLALYSKPGYDLNEITDGLSKTEFAELDSNLDKPWLNKALETYPPGSTFKVITALAALAAGVDPKDTIHCNGEFYVGTHRFRCHGVHGHVNMQQAMAQSCDTYFYTQAMLLGLEPMSKLGSLFGLGEPSSAGFGVERSGVMPNREWYEKLGRRFVPGLAVNLSIGQGDLLVTPLQLAMLYASIANNGTVYEPQIVEKVEDVDGKVLSSFAPKVRRRLDIPVEHFALVRDALVAVVKEGTLAEISSKFDSYSFAGKTGTAQVRKIGEVRRNVVDMAYFSRHHAWVAGFAPAENPQVALVVFVEHGGTGGITAGPIMLEIISRYFDIFGATGALSSQLSASSQPGGKP